MWVHCEFITLNEQMEEATTRPDILLFFGQEKFIFFREKSENLETLCLWQPCVHVFLCTHEIILFSVKSSTQYPTLHHTVLGQVT